ncbi:response regulator [Trichloromonas sp.]|jgi:DNA-binding NtrC family response regulator|uniref:response regulator n=1 Tax=Trichloromonas sp. TaxID=3069249 RepID=UPI002A40684E|nr:response regulator [Trichloromonas sp.]
MISFFKKLKKSEIVIVDDNEYYAQLIKANIYKKGFTNIKIFNEGETAVDYINKNKPICVILDHILTSNGLNGDGVLKKIKKYNNNINVIIISAQEDVKTAAELMKLGAFDYIIKNEDMTFFNLENSLSKLERILVIDNNKILTVSLILMGIIFILMYIFLSNIL